MLKYHEFITEGNDQFLTLYQEALTFITDEWTNWEFSISKLTTSIYSAKFKGEASFQDIQELITRLNSVKSHLGEDITKFEFTINYGETFELSIKVNFIKGIIKKDIKIDNILSLSEEDYLEIDIENLEDFLTKESGYKFEYNGTIDYNPNSGIENSIIFLVTLPKDLREKSEKEQDSILSKKMDDVLSIFDKDKLPDNFKDLVDGDYLVNYSYYDQFIGRPNLEISLSFATNYWINFNI